MSRDRESELWLKGDIHELGKLADWISPFADAAGLNLALEELFVNAVRHGGCEGLEQAVHICVREIQGGFEVEFRDRGRPFDFTAAPAADLKAPLAERQGSGLGIHLVRQLMREITWRREGEWNILNMRYIVIEGEEVA